MVIDPSKHYYEPYGNGYRIKIRYRGVISDHEDNKFIEFKKLRLPDMSRVVDFSVNDGGKPKYDSSLIVYGNSSAGDMNANSVTWNASLGYWTTHLNLGLLPGFHGASGWNHHYPKLVKGDFYFLMDDIGTVTPKFFMFDKDNYSVFTTDTAKYNASFNSPGLIRHFLDLSKQESGLIRFDIYNLNDGAKCQFFYSGTTLPINAMLYAGYYDSAYHKGAWYKDQSGNATYDASEAVKNVTKAACTKLKSDWGSNIRIYLIKYRRQTQYKHKVTGTATDFDYSYLNDCASGTSAPYMYDISSESELNSALSAIASNIKSWAGYKAAENK